MANPWRGQRQPHRPRLEAESLVELIGRFEAGAFRVRDLIALIVAGLNGGGWRLSEAELMARTIDGGPLAAAEAAARLLKLTFTVPDGEA